MRFTLLALTLSAIPVPTPAQQPPPPPTPITAQQIMARVATNQDRSDSERLRYVYVQHAHVTSRKGNTIMCEETADSRITPTSNGSHQQVLKLDGRLRHKGKYLVYNQLTEAKAGDHDSVEADQDDLHVGIDTADDAMDRDLVENMRDNLTNNKSKDGIGAGLFPLTSKIQADYLFTLVGREARNGRDCFHISFVPKDKDDFGWKGDAWIDAVAYQPVVVRTTMARKIPFAVRTLLGTSVPGLGFTVIYAPQATGTGSDPLWFPVSFGTEFKLHVLFFLNRQITISAAYHDFEKTHVSSRILAPDAPPHPEAVPTPPTSPTDPAHKI
jgi:hypothetical protein